MTPTATKPRPWTAKDRDWLREHYPRLGGAACALALGRTPGAVRYAARRAGVRRRLAAFGGAADLLRRAQAMGMTHAEQAAALGIPLTTLWDWRRRLGLSHASRRLAEARASLAGEMRAWASFHGRGTGEASHE